MTIKTLISKRSIIGVLFLISLNVFAISFGDNFKVNEDQLKKSAEKAGKKTVEKAAEKAVNQAISSLDNTQAEIMGDAAESFSDAEADLNNQLNNVQSDINNLETQMNNTELQLDNAEADFNNSLDAGVDQLNSQVSDEISLEDEFATTPTTSTDTSIQASNEEGSSQVEINPESAKQSLNDYRESVKNSTILKSFPAISGTDDTDQSENVNLATPFQLKKNEAALFGWSYGAIGGSQPLYVNYERVAIATGEVAKFDQQTDPIQTAGIFIRYAVTPYNKLGADVNVSYQASLNHDSVTFSQTKKLKQFFIAKFEFNFTYSLRMGGILPLYFMGGIGFQKMNGQNIEELLNTNGFGGQAGLGFALAGTLNLEGLYSYYEHRVSQTFYNEAIANSPTQFRVDTNKARITNRGLIGRLTYSQRF